MVVVFLWRIVGLGVGIAIGGIKQVADADDWFFPQNQFRAEVQTPGIVSIRARYVLDLRFKTYPVEKSGLGACRKLVRINFLIHAFQGFN